MGKKIKGREGTRRKASGRKAVKLGAQEESQALRVDGPIMGTVSKAALVSHLTRAAMRKRVDEVLVEDGQFAVVDEARNVLAISQIDDPPLTQWGRVGIGELGLFLGILSKMGDQDQVDVEADDAELRLRAGKTTYVFRLTNPEFVATKLAEPKKTYDQLKFAAVPMHLTDLETLEAAVQTIGGATVKFQARGGILRAVVTTETQHRAELDDLGTADGDVECTVDASVLMDVLSVAEPPLDLSVAPNCVIVQEKGYGYVVAALADITGRVENVDESKDSGQAELGSAEPQ